MCGRFSCALDPEVICRACRYSSTDGKLEEPKWIENPKIIQYCPSSNIAPTNYCPVLLSRKHFASEAKSKPDLESDISERVITPMRFGLIPSWHKGEASTLQISTINCRREGIMEKKTFASPLQKGRRCVVLAEGFYEWQKMEKSKTKQPYLIYLPEGKEFLQADDKVMAMSTPGKILPLMKMAAIFDIWHPKPGEPEVYSFSILTVDADKSLRWIHHRMPAILRTDEEVAQWLNFETVSTEKALGLIQPMGELVWHPVTRAMGNTSYKNVDASKPIKLDDVQKDGKTLAKGQTTMTSFFPKAKTENVSSENEEEPSTKRARIMKPESSP